MSVESLAAAKAARDAAQMRERLKMWGAIAALVAVAYFVTRKGR